MVVYKRFFSAKYTICKSQFTNCVMHLYISYLLFKDIIIIILFHFS